MGSNQYLNAAPNDAGRVCGEVDANWRQKRLAAAVVEFAAVLGTFYDMIDDQSIGEVH